MIKSLARKATLFLLDNKSIKLNQYELYLYGFETLIALIINILVILLVSIILSKFIETVLFLLVYCTIRQFTGGYHAENHFKCLLVFLLV
ncbi:TPA: accessory gene regulator B family protein, partial [Clostridioides difficile]|nr:accessory gene regulator B family protein [Clostridioides difficile]